MSAFNILVSMSVRGLFRKMGFRSRKGLGNNVMVGE